MRVLFVIVLVLSTSFVVFPQNSKIGVDPDKPLSSLSMDQWTGRDGLISNNLTSINQSTSKFLWATTFNGILRFDGVDFKLFDKTNLPFLNSNAFYKSFEDSKGNLWFTSQSSGIVKYDGSKFRQILNTTSSLSVRCITEDLNGKIWVGTNNDGVYFLDDSVLVKSNIIGLENAIVMDIAVDSHGKIWFATNGDGIFILQGNEVKRITSKEGLNHNTVNTLMKDSNGSIYAGTQSGINVFQGDEIAAISLMDGIEVNDILMDEYSNLWMGTELGLYKLHLPTNAFDKFTPDHGLPASQISSLCFDHENSLWISTKKAGLVRLRSGFFQNINLKDHLSSDNVNIITEHNGAYYIGCDDGLINVYKDHAISILKFKNTSYIDGIRDIQFVDDELFVASYRGLLRVNSNSEQLVDFTQYGSSNDIRRILVARDEIVWLATRSGGVIKYEGEHQVKVFNTSNGLKADYILALEEDELGDIYVGTLSGGLSIIKKGDEVANYPIESGKAGVLIFNLEFLADGSLLAATNIGVYSFNNEKFTKIDLDENLKAETIFDIVTEGDNAWLSSNIGLINIKLDHIQNYLMNNLDVVPGRLFDRYDGMASQECTGATRMTLSSKGSLLIPTLGGVAILDPASVEKNMRIPEVYITDFYTDFNQFIIEDQSRISIDPDVIRFEFDFTSLSYIAPPKVRFRYKLIGIDENWIEAGSERKALYTNLPKGKYTFSVIASNNDGIWNEKGSSFDFIVEPHFYETVLFYILLFLGLGFLVWGIIVWRIKNIERVNSELRKVNEELDRFVYSASHDLRAPLSSVMGLVEIARLEKTINAKDECLSMINDSVHKLDGFINDIIDYSRNKRIELQVNSIDLEFEVNDVFKELKFMDKENKIRKTFTCDSNQKLSSDSRRINIILKNLISNAIRYHDYRKEDQFIDVNASFNSNSVSMKISDNGIGIDKEHMQNIFKMFYRAAEGSKGSGLGLYIVKETVEKLDGKIEVSSEVGKGTTFTIDIPHQN